MPDARIVFILCWSMTMYKATSLPTEFESEVSSTIVHSGGNETLFPLPVTTTNKSEEREAATQSALSLEQRASTSSTCRLLTEDPYVHRELERIAASGTTDLVVYELTVLGSSQSIVELVKSDTENSSSLIYYRPWVGYRMLTSRGRSLMRLPFDRDILSFGLLRTNVHHLNVPLVDTPPDCYSSLPTSSGLRSAAVLDLLTRDMAATAEQSNGMTLLWDGSDGAVCRQVIERTAENVARFSMECCTRIIPTDIRVRCTILSRDHTVDALYYLPVVGKVAFMLFGPIVLLFIFFRRATGRCEYLVPLKAELKKTILVKKLHIEHDNCPMTMTSSSSFGDEQHEMKPQFTKFRKLVKQLPPEEIVQVRFRQMEIMINRSELLSQTEYPLDSLVYNIYEGLTSCAFFQRHSLTAGCCNASCLVGSFSSKFLWLRLLDGKDNSYCRYCHWVLVFRTVVWLITIGLVVPLPYYARLAVYYSGLDWQETVDRRNATALVDLDYILPSDPVRWLGPTHPLHVVIYAVYATSVIIVSIIYAQCPQRIEKLVRGCVEDFRRIRLSAFVRMIVAHLLLPVEKFGVIVGLVVGTIYWPLVLLICLLIGVCYFVPTIYVIGRLLIRSRPACLRQLPLPTLLRQSATADNLTEGVTSFESCCFLNSISPSGLDCTTLMDTSGNIQADMTNAPACNKPNKRQQAVMRRQNLSNCFYSFVIGIILVFLFISVIFMYAEAFGYLVEVVSMTAVGIVFSTTAVTSVRLSAASSGAMLYIVLGAWAIFYAAAVYRVVVVEPYLRLSRAVFTELRRHLGTEIRAVTRNKTDRNIAYKYFDADQELSLVPDGGTCTADNVEDSLPLAVEDSIEYHDGCLHWNVRSVVLFVDAHDDSLLMPRGLFQQLSQLNVAGCPGEGRALRDGVRWCLGVATYLTILGLAVRLAADVAMTSSLVPLAVAALLLGAVPLFVYLVVTGSRLKKPDEYLSNSAKIRRTMINYTHCWPVPDLSFVDADDKSTTCGGKTTTCQLYSDVIPSLSSATEGHDDVVDVVDMTQVDLLVTIRDDEAQNQNPSSAPVSCIENKVRSAASKKDSFTTDVVPVISHLETSEPSSTSTNPISTCIVNQPMKMGSVQYHAPMAEAADEVLPNVLRVADEEECCKKTDSTGKEVKCLQKQTSTSMLPLGNVVPIAESNNGMDGSSVLVVDLLTEGHVAAGFVKFPDNGFNRKLSHGVHGPKSAVSTRSLPSCKVTSLRKKNYRIL